MLPVIDLETGDYIGFDIEKNTCTENLVIWKHEEKNKIALDLAKTEMDRYWLFCYEALTSGNLSGDWKSMKEAEVSFIRPEILEIMKHT